MARKACEKQNIQPGGNQENPNRRQECACLVKDVLVSYALMLCLRSGCAKLVPALLKRSRSHPIRIPVHSQASLGDHFRLGRS